jgi:hypothetical protein
MTRAQIMKIARKSAGRVASNETGVAPTQERHVRRLAELKAKKRGNQDNYAPISESNAKRA